MQRLYGDATDNGNTIIEPRANILNKPGVIDPNSGRVLTIGEAIQSRILDVRTGEIVVNHERISIEEAIKRNLIDATLGNSLLQPGAAFHGGKPISLLEVIQREISEAENGYDSTEKRIKVITTTATASSTARNANDDDDNVGGTSYAVHSETVKIKPNELCLSDAIVHGLVDTSGWVMDRNSGDKFRLDSAIGNGLINPHVREIVDAKNDQKITIQQALDAGILNAKTGRYMQNVTKEKLTFIEAKNRQLIGKPMTLKDVCDLNLLEKNGSIISPTRRNKLSILDAINVGVLDNETIKSVTKTKDERVTLQQALDDGIILPDSKYRDAITQEEMSIPEAVERGLISSVSQRSIFNIDGFKDPFSNDFVSINVALNKNILRKKDGQFQLDTGKGNLMPLSDDVENGLVRPEFYEMINRPVGVFDATGKELSVLDLVYYDLIDPKSGFLLHPKTKAIVPLDHAIESKLITPEGALLLSSLLNITLTTETVTKTIRRYVTMTDDDDDDEVDPKSQVETVLTFTEAVRRGYIDENRQVFTDPNTGKIYSIQQALNHQLILPDSSSVDIPKPAARSTITLVRKCIEPVSVPLSETIQRTKTIHQVPLKGVVTTPPQEYSTFHSETKVEKKLDTKTITTDFLKLEQKVIPMQATEHFLELPLEGWLLSTAIERRLFDPMTGLFHIAATDRLVTFEECIQLEIINPDSVSVIDPTNGRKTTVKRGFEKRILDPLGNYKKNNKTIGMKQAIDSGLIILEDVTSTSPSTDKTTIHVVHDASKAELQQHVLIQSRTQSQDIPSPEPVQLVPGIIYDPSTALVIFTETGQSENILTAVEKGLVDSNMVKIIDPKTGTPLTVKEAIESGVVDSKTGQVIDASNNKLDLISASKLGLLAVIGSPLVAVAGAIDSLRFVLDPKTGQQIPYEIAYERGLITREELLAASPSYSPSHTAAETKYTVSFGRSPLSPERESKPIVLQKMRKKIVKPKDAVAKGLIDARTAEALESKEVFLDENGDVQTLSDVVNANKIAGNSGEIIDPQRGDVLTINKAIERGILDSDGTNQILVPLNKSLSVAQLKEQGLIDPKTSKIIHPETGTALTLREAIICEIVDPLSQVVDPHTNEPITLATAIEKGVVDDENCLVRAKQGKVDLLTAIQLKSFPAEPKTTDSKEMPPLGMTLAVAIKRGAIDPKTQEFVHPITGERVPLLQAIDNNTIMALPYTPNIDSVNISDAIDSNLIDFTAGTMKNPNTSEIVPISEAIENGLLVVKPLPELIALHSSGPHTSVTETVTSYHTITTKMVELLSGYVMVSPNEVKHLQTGQILSIEEAKQMGIIKDESQTSQQYATREIKVNFSDAIRRGLVDIKAGTYTDPSSGTTMPIQQAVNDGILETDDKSDNEGENTPKTESMTLSEAVETIYDENTKQFRDPKDPKRMVSFTDAMNEGIIDSKSVVFDVRAGKAQTLEDSVKAGLLDAKTGEVKQPTGKKVNVKQAAKLGLMAVVGAPILAGMAVAEAVKSITKKSDKSVKAEKLQKAEKPSKAQEPSIVEKFEIVGKSEKPALADAVKTGEKPVPLARSTVEEAIEPGTASTETITTTTTTVTITTNKTDQPEMPEAQLMHGKEKNVITETVELLRSEGMQYPEVIEPSTSTVEESFIPVIRINETLTPEQLEEYGIFDAETESFINPATQERIPFYSFIYDLNLFDPSNIFVKDLSKNVYEPFEVALEKPLIDKNSGHMVDSKTGQRVPFLECARRRWILEQIPEEDEEYDENEPDYVDTSAAEGPLKSPGVESVSEEIEPESIVSGIKSGAIRIERLIIKDPVSGQAIPMSEAVDRGIVDLREGVIINPQTKETIEFSKACDDGILLTAKQPPISLEAIVRQQLYDPSEGVVYDIAKRNSYNIRDAIDNGIIHPEISLIKDESTNETIPLSDALNKQLVLYTGKVKRKNEWIPLNVAFNEGLILTKPINWDLLQVLIKQYYSPNTGTFLNPTTGNSETLEDALKSGWIDISSVLVKDEQIDDVVPMNDAIKSGLVDINRGIITRPELPLDDALSKGYLMSAEKPYSLAELIMRHLYDPMTGLLTIEGSQVTLEMALKDGLVHTQDMVINDPRTGEIITLLEAIRRGIIDPRTGIAIDPRSGLKLTLIDAFERGILIQSKRKCTLPDAVFKGIYDPKSGKFSTSQAAEKLSAERAIRRGIIDAQSTIVNVKGRVLPFELAAESGIVDVRRGMVLDDYDNKIDFREAFDRGILIEVKKPISLCETILKGLYDEQTGLFMDPKSGKRLTISQSLGRNLIDPNSVQMKDLSTGLYKPISLNEAIQTGLIDGENALILIGDKRITLREAFDLGLLTDTNAPISIQRAIHQGLYDSKSGKIHDNKSGRKITLLEAIRRFSINPQLPCYFNEHEEALLSLGETCRARLIDRREGVFKEPGSDVFVPLNEAMALGLIVDIENGSFGLYEVIAMGLYDRHSRLIIHPVNNRRLTLDQACVEDLVSPIASLVKDTTTGKYLKLNEAVKMKIIDDAQGVYVHPNYTVDLHEARTRGLIVSNQKMLSVEKAVKMKLLNVDNGKFTDPAVNRPFNLQESIDNNLIDCETTVFKNFLTGQYKPLKQAIAEGDIDVLRGKVLDPKSKLAYTYDIAFEKGLLVTIDKPVTGRIRRDSIDLSMSPVLKTPREMSLRDAIRYEVINPETSVFKDPITGKFKSLKQIIDHIDPEIRAVVDPKSLFFVFDKTFVIYTREPISFEYAVESKQLDLSTGKFTDSLDTTNKEHLLKDAIGQGMIDPESALIKDGAKNKLVRLPEAYRKGLVDAEKANVVDTITSKLYTLQAAYDTGLVITPKRSFGLLEAISYQLYQPHDGQFVDPFATTSAFTTVEPSQQPQVNNITLNDAITTGLIDPTTTVVRDTSNSTIIPLQAAITLNIIDAVNGHLVKSDNETIDLAKAQEKGFLLPAEQRVSCYCDHAEYQPNNKASIAIKKNQFFMHLPLYIFFFIDVVVFYSTFFLSYLVSS